MTELGGPKWTHRKKRPPAGKCPAPPSHGQGMVSSGEAQGPHAELHGSRTAPLCTVLEGPCLCQEYVAGRPTQKVETELQPPQVHQSVGALSRSAFRAPIVTVSIPRTPLQNAPPTEARIIHSKQPRGCRVQDPATRGYRGWKTADLSHSTRCAPCVMV